MIVPVHLVMIFGPPAVGKMTVGRELSKLTGYPLFHNHMSIEPVLDVFPWGSPSFGRLTSELRRRVIEEAVLADLPGLIFTYVWALDDPADREYVDWLTEPVRAAGSRLDFVELYADQATRLAREGTALRMEHKRSKHDVDASRRWLRDADAAHRLSTSDDFVYPTGTCVWTTADSPRQRRRAASPGTCRPQARGSPENAGPTGAGLPCRARAGHPAGQDPRQSEVGSHLVE